MQTRPVGASGLQVSRLGLGTLTWARDTTREQARGLLHSYVEAGGNLLDTAAAYGAGDAERLVGELLAELGQRDEMVIATKAGFVVRNGARVVDTSRRASSEYSTCALASGTRPGNARCQVAACAVCQPTKLEMPA